MKDLKRRPKKVLKAKPKVQNPKFQKFIIFSPDFDHLEFMLAYRQLPLKFIASAYGINTKFLTIECLSDAYNY